jgi:hypothetical protein
MEAPMRNIIQGINATTLLAACRGDVPALPAAAPADRWIVLWQGPVDPAWTARKGTRPAR